MKLLVEQELLRQAIVLLDNLENDNNQIPNFLWKERNRMLNNAKYLGYRVYNADENPKFKIDAEIWKSRI